MRSPVQIRNRKLNKRIFPRLFALALAVGAATLLSGCKQELYSTLTEDDANQMLAVLMENSIPTDKMDEGKNGFALDVDTSDMLRAIAVLKDAGYPKTKYQTMAQMFQPSGLMASPFEERVRYIYALGEEVAQTLSRIDGVVTARVQIVLPDPPELGEPVKPSSAAVFIKYEPGVDLDYFVPQIKRLVSSSIEGLDYSAVTVVLDEAAPMRPTPIGQTRSTVEVLPGLSVPDAEEGPFWAWALGGCGLLVLLVGTNLTLLYFWRGKALLKRNGGPTNVAAVEPS
jgi:type III secretion protein J